MRPERDDPPARPKPLRRGEGPLGPAIRRALQDSRTDCPDAEAIAAYADRTLATAERRDVERHLSGCARCRGTLLLMSRAAEAETPATPSSRFLLHRWPWLAGAAAAGLAIVLWIALPPTEVQAPRADSASQIAGDVALEKPPALGRQKAAEPSPAPPPPAAPTVPPARESRDRLEGATDKRRSDERKQEEAAGARHAEVQAPAAAPAPPRAAAEPLAKTPPAARDAAERNVMARARQNREYMTASWPSVPGEASAVRPAITWRVWASGGVERSTDGGATWSRETAVDAQAARAIHAPSRDVCW
ncbi:MAG: zf-HC2 domain-containing protein, partial [Vicinamibacterales bacterium]